MGFVDKVKNHLNDIVCILLGIVCLFVWQTIAEKWETFGDGVHYLNITAGKIVKSPFGYRIFLPLLIRYLPFDYILSYKIVAFVSLVFIGYLLSLYVQQLSERKDDLTRYLSVILYFLSYGPVYYATAHVKVDPLALLIIMLLFYGAYNGWNIVLLGSLLAVGVATHEYVLFVVPCLITCFLIKLSAHNCLLIDGKYKLTHIFVAILLALLSFYLIRILVPVSGASMSYQSGILIVKYVLGASGGIIKHIARIWAAFGILWFLAFSEAVFFEKKQIKLFFSIVIIVIGLMSLIAVDTLRVATLAYPFVILFACNNLSEMLNKKFYTRAIAIIITHVIYSIIVFGHLHSFEKNSALQRTMVLVLIFQVILIITTELKLLKSMQANRSKGTLCI